MKKLFALLLLISILISSCQNSSVVMESEPTIGTIQGCGHISPYNGRKVRAVEGVVTFKFKNGFTIQSIVNDSLPCTSDAIFITTGIYPSVFPGQLVSVDGIVNEFTPGVEEDHNLSRTEIHNPAIEVKNENIALPLPIILGQSDSIIPTTRIKLDNSFDIQNNGLDFYESLEFVLVEVNSGIVVGPMNSYNEFIVLPDEYRANNLFSRQGVLLQKPDDENPEIIMVDVASSFSKGVNVGDSFTKPIIGIMDYSFGNYKIWTINNPEIQTNKITQPTLQIEDQTLSLVSYNIENFSRFDETSRISKFGCQVIKNLRSPDIIMLHEVLDDSGIQDDQVVTSTQTLQLLTEAIHSCGGPLYIYSDNPPINNRDGGIQGGNIRTTVIYREDSGVVLDIPIKGVDAISFQDGLLTINQNPLRLFSNSSEYAGTRKPSIWSFTWHGEQYLVLGLHLVSQSASSPSWGEIQPPDKPEQEKRVKQMQLVSEFIKNFLAQNSSINLIVMGDFNDYPWSETIQLLGSSTMNVLSDKDNQFENFSYIHEGNGIQFDYAAVSNHLLERVSNYSIVHLNTIFNSDDQISDHDPIFLEITSK